MEYDWQETGNGNWVLIGDDEVEATVYQAGDEWRAVWNGAPDGKPRRLKAKYTSATEAMAATESAVSTAIRRSRRQTRQRHYDAA